MSERRIALAIAAYALVGVGCFGPATVQSERARDEYRAQCKAERAGDTDAQRWCIVGGPSVSDGLHKAIFWPLWLSYMAASR
jgi:hypothetical protein